MIEFLHFLGMLFGVSGIVFAVFASGNLLAACALPKNYTNEIYYYSKKSLIFLGLMILSLVLMVALITI